MDEKIEEETTLLMGRISDKVWEIYQKGDIRGIPVVTLATDFIVRHLNGGMEISDEWISCCVTRISNWVNINCVITDDGDGIYFDTDNIIRFIGYLPRQSDVMFQ